MEELSHVQVVRPPAQLPFGLGYYRVGEAAELRSFLLDAQGGYFVPGFVVFVELLQLLHRIV